MRERAQGRSRQNVILNDNSHAASMLKVAETTGPCECLSAAGDEHRRTLQDNVYTQFSGFYVRKITCLFHPHLKSVP